MEDKKIGRIQELVYEMKVSDVMTKEVITVTPKTLMGKLRLILRLKRISGTPVVCQGKLVGIISIEDFIEWIATGKREEKVENRMTRKVFTLFNDAPLVLAVNKLEHSGFGRFPVIDRNDNKLVGVITKGDIVEGLLRKLEIDYREEELHSYRKSHIFEDIIADRAALTFQYRIVGQDFKRAGMSSKSLRKTLKHLGLHPDTIRKVAIVAYEAEMNIVVFTDGGEILTTVEPGSVFIEAKDSGPGIPDIEKAMRPGFSTAPDWVREKGFGAGLGLNNMKRCSDEMDLDSELGKGTHIKIKVVTDETD